jgi:hypothetical protein
MQGVQVKVQAAAGGWLIFCSCSEPLAFFSGAVAEARAHGLGKSIARAGSDSVVVVQDRSGRVVGTTRYFGDAAA